MICPNCGMCKHGAEVCPRCGTRINLAAAKKQDNSPCTNQSENSGSGARTQTSRNRKKPKKLLCEKWWLWVILACFQKRGEGRFHRKK